MTVGKTDVMPNGYTFNISLISPVICLWSQILMVVGRNDPIDEGSDVYMCYTTWVVYALGLGVHDLL